MKIQQIRTFLWYTSNLINKVLPGIDLQMDVKPKAYFVQAVWGSHPKKVLVSYLSEPFRKGVSSKHTNLQECHTAALIFNELGYQIDVIDYYAQHKVDFSKYDIIYGFGDPYENSFYDKGFKGKRILYSPGCNTVYSNIVSAAAVKKLYPQLGYYPVYLSRCTNNAWPYQKYLSDGIITLGNDFVSQTYLNDNPTLNVYSLPAFFTKSFTPLNRDYSKIKCNFLWFGSQGSVHKGLDVALNLIAQNPETTLYICGYQEKNEPELSSLFTALFNQGRAVNCGFMDINSEPFVQLLNKCGAALFPSVSEGGSPALLTLMGNAGLIPITTFASGIDFDGMGFVATSNEPVEIQKAFNAYMQTPDEILEEQSIQICNRVSASYTLESYRSNLAAIIQKLLNKK